MTRAAEQKLADIAAEVERLEDACAWNLRQFRRLYSAALQACEGEEAQLEFFGPFMRSESFMEEARKLSKKNRSAA